MSSLDLYRDALAGAAIGQRIGWVRRMHGLAIHCEGPDVRIGEMCRVVPGEGGVGPGVLAEVVGFEPEHVVLMPYGPLRGIGTGARVVALAEGSNIPVGNDLLGRVIDGFGDPLDGNPPLRWTDRRPLQGSGPSPLERPRIKEVLETGVRSVDALLTIGKGQRVGIFAGSGVGKSTLLGMFTRQAKVDVNVVSLIGERGREVREFIEEQLGAEGLARSVVVVATSDQPALARIRAAHAAVAIASYFREQGCSVLLTMDSITRLAMARREVGLAAGEPATARGYTPSVFAELPQICERCGTSPSGGSVTALLTVLVEGDDLNEPVADSMRSILDGHIVLSRELAQQGHYPPIDIVRSASRLLPDLATAAERALALETVRHVFTLEKSRDLVDLGAYVQGSNDALDTALALEAPLYAWLRQDRTGSARRDALVALERILAAGRRT